MAKWEVVRLGDYTNIKTGKLDANASSENGEYPFFTCSKNPLRISSYSYECECVLVAGNGDLNTKYYNGKFDAYQRTYIIESKTKEELSVRYLYYFLDKYVEILREQSIGGVIKYIKLGNLTEALLPLPPLQTQQKIAEVLDKASSLIEKRKAQIAKLDLLVKSQFVEMFGDVLRNNKGWDKEPLENLCSISRGGSPRPIEQYLGGTIPWIKIGDASTGDDVYLHSTKDFIIAEGIKKSRYIKAGSLIFANCGVSLGFARIITFDGCIHDGWLSFENIDERLNKVFLLKSLNQCTNYFRKTAPDGTQPNLNTGIMKLFQQILPPLELQNRFIALAEAADKSKFEMRRQLAMLERNYQSLMQKCFRGEIF